MWRRLYRRLRQWGRNLPSLSLGADLSITAFTQSTTAPTAPTAVIGAGDVAALITAPAFTAPSLTLPSLVLPSAPTIADLDLSSISVPTVPASPVFSTPFFTVGSPPIYLKPSQKLDISTALSTVTTHCDTNHDIELATTKLSQIAAAIGEYEAALSDNLNAFNANVAQYQATLQKDIELSRQITGKSLLNLRLRLISIRRRCSLMLRR